MAWLTLTAELRTNQAPERTVGRIHIDAPGMVPITAGPSSIRTWLWELLPEDVMLVEVVRSAQPKAPITFYMDVRGVATLSDTASGQLLATVPLRGSDGQLVIEPTQWERLIEMLGYALPPQMPMLAGAKTMVHPDWQAATVRLDQAWMHYRRGEHYQALNLCLSSLEDVVPAPYNRDSWLKLMDGVPNQKADAIAALLSGLGTYCNRVGHHRERTNRDPGGDLPQMPVDHWEVEMILGAAQFMLTYALRLRSTGVLVKPSPLPRCDT